MAIQSPFEILDSRRQRDWTFTPIGYEEGVMTINTAEVPDGKLVQVARVTVDRASKPHAPYYWDVTAKTLIPELRELIPFAIKSKRTVTIHAIGYGVETRFSVEVQ